MCIDVTKHLIIVHVDNQPTRTGLISINLISNYITKLELLAGGRFADIDLATNGVSEALVRSAHPVAARLSTIQYTRTKEHRTLNTHRY